MRTFGNDFKQFALAADLLRKDDFPEIRDVVRRYIKVSFQMYKVELLKETVVSGERGLKPEWDSEDIYGAYKVQEDDQPNGLNALCFLTEKPLWIVATGTNSNSTLALAEDYIDCWSSVSVNIKFKRFNRLKNNRWSTEDKTKTLVTLPVCSDGRVCAVLCAESEYRLPCTKAAQEELRNIVEGIGILYSMVEHRQSRRDDTKRAIEALKNSFPRETINIFGFDKTRIFFAYASKADKKVLSLIKRGIDEFSDVIEIIDWKTISASGVINQQILNSIKSSKYGICYFSEPHQGNSNETQLDYVDNPNVLFEAGMLHIMSNYSNFGIANWLPIRESYNASRIPFDFRDLRVLEVPRYNDGRLDEDEFYENLKTRLTSLFREEIVLESSS